MHIKTSTKINAGVWKWRIIGLGKSGEATVEYGGASIFLQIA